MKKFFARKRTVLLTAVAVLAVAGAAVAYWTSTGSGSGTGTVKAENGTVVLSGVITNPLAPGLSSPVTFTADNANDTSLKIGSVQLVSVAADSGHTGCAVADFTMPPVVENQVIDANTDDVPLTNDGTITYANTDVNQDACKGAALTLTLSATQAAS